MELIKLFKIRNESQVLVEYIGWSEDSKAYEFQIKNKVTEDISLTYKISMENEQEARKSFVQFNQEQAESIGKDAAKELESLGIHRTIDKYYQELDEKEAKK